MAWLTNDVNGYHGINGTFDLKPVNVWEVRYGVYHEAVMIAARGAKYTLTNT